MRVVLERRWKCGSAVVYGSLIVIVVFIPIFMLPGLVRLVLPSAGDRVRPRDSRVAARRADRDAGTRAHAAARAHISRRIRRSSAG